jgi:integrase
VERFLTVKQREGQVGVSWVRRMRWELNRFPRLAGHPAPGSGALRPRDVTRAQLGELRRSCRWERVTFAIHFAALRQFLAWAHNPLAVEKGPWRLPSGEPGRRRWLSKEQLLRLADQPHGRGRALVLLEGFNGLRRVEVLRLRAKDVLFDERSLRVLGKGRAGGKWRKIPMDPTVAEELQRLANAVPGDARLFAMSSSGADRLLKQAVGRTGLGPPDGRISHHDLRRTFGRLAYSSGMDLVQLRNLLGHASVDMTAHYVGLDADEMRAGLQRFVDAVVMPGAPEEPGGRELRSRRTAPMAPRRSRAGPFG